MTTPAWAHERHLPALESLQYTRSLAATVLIGAIVVYVLARMVRTGKPARTVAKVLRNVTKV